MHPSIKILSLIFIGIWMHRFSVAELSIFAGLMALAMLYWRINSWFLMLWRMRLLFVSIFLVYALTTPGEYLRLLPEVSITYEGLYEGFMQIARLGLMLSAIALLIATTTRNELIAGFYGILKPLSYLKLAPERFAARLCLTLQYLEDAEAAKKERKPTANQQWSAQKAWQDLFNLDFWNQVHQPNPSQAISLEMPALHYKDWMVLVVICVLAWKI